MTKYALRDEFNSKENGGLISEVNMGGRVSIYSATTLGGTLSVFLPQRHLFGAEHLAGSGSSFIRIRLHWYLLCFLF